MRTKVCPLVLFVLVTVLGTTPLAGAEDIGCGSDPAGNAANCTPAPDSPLPFPTGAAPLPLGGAGESSAAVPKVVFQINQAADAPTVLRFVANYLAAEPGARVAVVGYGGGAEFMLKGAKDPAGRPFADQVRALAQRGVAFKACNNTLKARNLTAGDVIPEATVVPGAVNEIIRLQTREGYAYFRH